MTLQLRSERQIKSIQNDFAAEFPFLKLEFFARVEAARSPMIIKKLLPSGISLRDVEGFHVEGTLEIDSTMPVAELERQFREKYGILVQVFRRSGNIWLETTMTDSWTLRRQNDHGREISTEPATIPTPPAERD